MKNILIWETLNVIGGGQQISLCVGEIIREKHNVSFLIPQRGPLSCELEKRGFNYFLSDNCTLSIGKKNLLSIIKYGGQFLKQIKIANKIISENAFDVIYVPGALAIPWACIVGTICNVPVIWHIHHIFEDKKSLLLLNFFVHFRCVKKVISVSETVAAQIKQVEKTHVLYNPVNLDKFKNLHCLQDIRLDFSLSSDAFIITQVGLIQKNKCQDISIKALEKLLENDSNIYLLIVGEARPYDNGYKEELNKIVNEKHLESNVIFTGQREDVNRILYYSDVTLVLGLEGFSLVALESMAAKTPVIAADRGGVQELIQKSNAGYLIPADQPLEVAKTIAQIKNNIDNIDVIDNGCLFAQSCDFKLYKEKVKKFIDDL